MLVEYRTFAAGKHAKLSTLRLRVRLRVCLRLRAPSSVWARAILLTTPTVATVGCSLTIPIAFASDFVLHGDVPKGLSVFGASLMVVGFCFVGGGDNSSSGVRVGDSGGVCCGAAECCGASADAGEEPAAQNGQRAGSGNPSPCPSARRCVEVGQNFVPGEGTEVCV